jgi:hypothetical protein
MVALSFRLPITLVINLIKIMEWTNTLIDMPLCYETGAWDGKRSDEVLVEDDEGRRYVARMYSGQMDGSYFADWISNDGYIINKEIVRWLKIPA